MHFTTWVWFFEAKGQSVAVMTQSREFLSVSLPYSCCVDTVSLHLSDLSRAAFIVCHLLKDLGAQKQRGGREGGSISGYLAAVPTLAVLGLPT